MTEHADPSDNGLRILLEALTTISYQKGGDGKAAAIAEYALDRYGRAIRDALDSARQAPGPEGLMEWESDRQGVSGQYPEQRNHPMRRRSDRLHANNLHLIGHTERRFNADRRVNPDRRCNASMNAEQ